MKKLTAMAAWIISLAGTSSLEAADDLPEIRAKLAAHERVKIVCLGDSVTGIYYHTGGLRAYPEMIAVGLKIIDPESKVTVINAGISGHATNNGTVRLEKDVLAHKPDLVTVMYGLNDMVRIPPADFQANLTTIVERCRGIGAEVLFCTPNGIVDTPGRPQAKLEEYNQFMKEVGEQLQVPVSDVYAAYQDVRKADPLAFRLMCSDPFHPNMDGHKLNAETICRAITGKPVSLKDVGPPEPALPRTRKRLEAKEPVQVYAMTPFDQWIGPALKAKSPDAKIEVKAWSTKDQSRAELHEAAKAVRQMLPKPDLVVVAIPLELTPPLSAAAEAYISDYVWTLNYALSFGLQEWDVIAISPSVMKAELSAVDADREAFARRMIRAQDLHLIARPENSVDEAQMILTKWITR